jgi:short-subunit dehydrogenase
VPTTSRTALVTGASSGIGEAFAELLASEGFDLIITARRQVRLADVAERLRRQHGGRVDVIAADLSERGAPERLCEEVGRLGLSVDVLVNNAGYGVPGTFIASPWERQAALLQVMVVTLTELTHRLLPAMVDRGYGRIINVASLAAFVPAPAGHTLYAACKAFVVKFSESLAGEVLRSGVHVTALCPGFTLSEFHDVTGTRATVRKLPSWLWMSAEDVAREGFDAVMAGRPAHVTGGVNRALAILAQYTPRPLLVALGRRTARLYRKT